RCLEEGRPRLTGRLTGLDTLDESEEAARALALRVAADETERAREDRRRLRVADLEWRRRVEGLHERPDAPLGAERPQRRDRGEADGPRGVLEEREDDRELGLPH